jgi:hypothetical protein
MRAHPLGKIFERDLVYVERFKHFFSVASQFFKMMNKGENYEKNCGQKTPRKSSHFYALQHVKNTNFNLEGE